MNTKKKIFFVCLSVLLIKCKSNEIDKHKKESDKSEFCELFAKMNSDDQLYRGLDIMTDPFFKILDSIAKVDGILSRQEYSSLSEEQQLEYGKRAREIANSYPKVDQKIKDSLMGLQKKLDNKNTELLIQFIKDNGFPQKDSLHCKKMPHLIFRHSDVIYWEEIRSLINEAFEKGRIDEFYYGFILNHIGGRKENNYKILIQNEKNKDSTKVNFKIN